MPFSCNGADVAVLGKLAASPEAARASVIEGVRDQHNTYDIYSDPVFLSLVYATFF